MRPDIQLSFLLFRVNRVPVILISFRNRFLAFAPTITEGELELSLPSAMDRSASHAILFFGWASSFFFAAASFLQRSHFWVQGWFQVSYRRWPSCFLKLICLNKMNCL